jgi:pyruvate,water dikinase
MTLNPSNGDRSKVMIESVWGLGEPLVSGEANPTASSWTRSRGGRPPRHLREGDGSRARPRDGPGHRAGRGAARAGGEPSLTPGEVAELVRVARLVERAAGAPQDGEFAVLAGEAPDNVCLLQCRPETVWSRKPPKAHAPGRTAMQAVLATLTQKQNPDPREAR